MSVNKEHEKIYKTIGDVAKELGLINHKSGHIQTHTIRYWETQFREIKPSIRAGGRRYYSSKNIKLIKYIMYLLKDKGLTIKGVRKLLNNNDNQSIDENMNLGVYKPSLKTTKIIKDKIKKISKIISELKKLKNG
jgi:DNA-binding transcriptional MerR regulator|tara:strand:- start:384 stop:788 length:405 start_codon:yes stop_codon:yes gene_type:complete